MATRRNEPGTAERMGGLKRQIHQHYSPRQLGHRERNKASYSTTYPRTQDDNPYPENKRGSTKRQRDISASNNHARRGSHGLGRIQKTTKIEPFTRRIPKTHEGKAMPKMRTARTPSRCLHKTRSAKTIQPTSRQLATCETEYPMANTTEDSGNRS